MSLRLWNGFSAHVKGNGWCLSAPLIWKIQFKRMRERMVLGLFSFPHTERYENDVLLWGGNDANRTAEKFLHNSIQFLLNPNGKRLCQQRGGTAKTKREDNGRGWENWKVWTETTQRRKLKRERRDRETLRGERSDRGEKAGNHSFWQQWHFKCMWLISRNDLSEAFDRHSIKSRLEITHLLPVWKVWSAVEK